MRHVADTPRIARSANTVGTLCGDVNGWQPTRSQSGIDRSLSPLSSPPPIDGGSIRGRLRGGEHHHLADCTVTFRAVSV